MISMKIISYNYVYVYRLFVIYLFSTIIAIENIDQYFFLFIDKLTKSVDDRTSLFI